MLLVQYIPRLMARFGGIPTFRNMPVSPSLLLVRRFARREIQHLLVQSGRGAFGKASPQQTPFLNTAICLNKNNY